MQEYKEFSPTPFDGKGPFLPDQGNWLVVPVSRTRDTGAFEESNFEAALALLGGESDTVEVHRFGHWGPGWFEIIIVDPADEKALAAAADIEARLADYPLLNEEDCSNREYEGALESWESWGHSDFVRALDFGDNEQAADLVRDNWDSGDTWAVLMDNAGNPYAIDSGGTYFPDAESIAKDIGRSDLAKIARSILAGNDCPYSNKAVAV